MPKFLVCYTFRYHGEAQFSRAFHTQDEELTERDLRELEDHIRKDPANGIPHDSVVRILSVADLAPDRPEPEKPKKGCAVLVGGLTFLFAAAIFALR